MTDYKNIQNFLNQESLAIIGVSRDRKKFGNAVYRELKKKRYRVFAVNPRMETIEGEKCYPNLKALPEKPGGIVVVVPPSASEAIVRKAGSLGIRHVWLQQGAQSEGAIRYCNENGMNVVYGKCIFMFVEPVESIHRFHRFIWRLLGKVPRMHNGQQAPIAPMQ